MAMAQWHHEAGRLQEAERLYRQTLHLDPDHIAGWAGLGLALLDAGRRTDAIAAFRHKLALVPDDADGWCHLGMALRSDRQSAAAVSAYGRSLTLQADYPESWFNLANALTDLSRFDLAVDAYVRAVALSPDFAAAWCNLGNALHERGLIARAVASVGHAIALQPDYVAAYNNLGNALLEQGRFEAALAVFGRAIQLQPGDPQPSVGTGMVLRQQGRTEEAVAAFGHAHRLSGDPGLLGKQAVALPIIPDSVEHIARVRDRVLDQIHSLRDRGLRLDDPLRQVGQTTFYLAYHGLDDRPLQQALADFYAQACPDLLYTAPHVADPPRRPDGRLRLALVSEFFYQHTIGKLNRGLIEQLDRARFHLTLAVTPHAGDPLRRALLAAADDVVELPRDLAAARAQLAAGQFDLLYYTDIGMSALTYFLAFARLAPVQCLTWGHPDTTGIANLDYFLSCDAMEPPGAHAHYSETLLRLPGPTLHYPRPALPAAIKPRAAFGLPDDAHLYVCPQSLFKIHPDFDAVLVALLRRDPKALVVLISGRDWHLNDLLKARIARIGGDVVARLRILRPVPLADFLSLMAVSDVMLDPLHYSGGNTSLEAFALGTPIVTWPGRFMRGRHTHGFYQLMGVSDCVAADPEAYVDLALRLAADRAGRHDLTRTLLDRSHVLYDRAETIRALENALLDAAGRKGMI
jgi:protein O-GlcNAc transferase